MKRDVCCQEFGYSQLRTRDGDCCTVESSLTMKITVVAFVSVTWCMVKIEDAEDQDA